MASQGFRLSPPWKSGYNDSGTKGTHLYPRRHTISREFEGTRLIWPGRALSEKKAFEAPKGFLDPGPNLDLRSHLLIEGDNLEVLKLLLPILAEQIRIIYIDPPYNTGNRMLYHDRYSKRSAESRVIDRHDNWLSMIFPRLLLAHRFLKRDGVLFVSIDDHEVHHLRTLMDEIFGEENFVSMITWRKKVVRGRGNRHVLPQTEYILVYAREISALPAFSEPLSLEMRKAYPHADEKGPYKKIPFAKSGTRQSPRPNLLYPITAPDGTVILCPTHQWRWSRETFERRQDEILIQKNRHGRWTVYTKQYLREEGKERRKTPESYYDRVTTTDGTREMKEIFGEVLLDFPKPSRLIRDLIGWASPPGSSDLVMDFFAGSGTTGQAVLELNHEDGGERSAILVQSGSPTAYPGFPTIWSICRERVCRTRQRILTEGGNPLPVSEIRMVSDT